MVHSSHFTRQDWTGLYANTKHSLAQIQTAELFATSFFSISFYVLKSGSYLLDSAQRSRLGSSYFNFDKYYWNYYYYCYYFSFLEHPLRRKPSTNYLY